MVGMPSDVFSRRCNDNIIESQCNDRRREKVERKSNCVVIGPITGSYTYMYIYRYLLTYTGKFMIQYTWHMDYIKKGSILTEIHNVARPNFLYLTYQGDMLLPATHFLLFRNVYLCVSLQIQRLATLII